ncbi:hypothetical protein IF2G_09690 [Cordyceps javanica]|nr:hypothetical protein IF2G_09690 [Cordyceps javanica]
MVQVPAAPGAPPQLPHGHPGFGGYGMRFCRQATSRSPAPPSQPLLSCSSCRRRVTGSHLMHFISLDSSTDSSSLQHIQYCAKSDHNTKAPVLTLRTGKKEYKKRKHPYTQHTAPIPVSGSVRLAQTRHLLENCSTPQLTRYGVLRS